MANAPSPEFLTNLRKGIVESFNLAELVLLCADLGSGYDEIAGEGKQNKAQELIHFLKRRGQLAKLLQYCIANRPDYPWPQPDDKPLSQDSGTKTQTVILFLASDPTDQSRLRIGEEFQKIKDNLQAAGLRDQFKLELPILSVQPANIARALLEVQPQIVHFSGHADLEGLVFEQEAGQTHFVDGEALAALFEQFKDQVHCVVLNACYSEIQAKAIARHIEYVIGMNRKIKDKAAIAFSVGFYQALGAGRNMEQAYKMGCVQIGLEGIPGHLTPVLIKKY